jgi:[ribosomal protein S5]-alanine N-acetyltransferase
MKYLLTNQETGRLKFRLLQESDFELWLPLFYGENVALFLGMDTRMSASELCKFWFDKVFHRYENDLGGMNVLIDKKSNRLVGQCGLLIQTVEEEEKLEIGYSVLPEFCNMGYATEAAQKCKDFAFKEAFAESLISIVHIDNISSEMVAVKNGMTVGNRVASFNGMPVKIYGINRGEWLASMPHIGL